MYLSTDNGYSSSNRVFYGAILFFGVIELDFGLIKLDQKMISLHVDILPALLT